MKYHAQTPDWALTYDSTEDLTDCLYDVSREACEYGYTCTGYFDHAEAMGQNERHEDITVTIAILKGISIDHSNGLLDHGHERVYYYGPKEATRILGADAMARIDEQEIDPIKAVDLQYVLRGQANENGKPLADAIKTAYTMARTDKLEVKS